jgi:hypothetical protein
MDKRKVLTAIAVGSISIAGVITTTVVGGEISRRFVNAFAPVKESTEKEVEPTEE